METVSTLNQTRMQATTNLPKVLIVEDDIQLNRLLQKGFAVANLTTVSTYNLADALNVIQKENIAVIVLDLGLPDGSGLEIVNKLKAAHGSETTPKIIIITGRDPAEVQKESAEVKDYHILQKPVNVTSLIRLAIQVRYGRKI